jgi:ESX secretion-associated protein EspG
MRDPDSGWLQLSSTEFVVLWQALGFGDLPAVLELDRLGRTRKSAQEHAEHVSAALQSRELGTVARPARDVALTLRTIAEYTTCADLVVHGDGVPLRGLAATGRGGAAALAKVGDEIRMGSVPSHRMIEALLDSLSPLPGGPGRPVNVGIAEYRAACEEGERDGVTGFVRALQAGGLRDVDASTLAKAVTRRRAGGQLGASARTPREHRAGTVLNWLDTDDGRYAVQLRAGWLTITPVDAARLVRMAGELVDEVR